MVYKMEKRSFKNLVLRRSFVLELYKTLIETIQKSKIETSFYINEVTGWERVGSSII